MPDKEKLKGGREQLLNPGHEHIEDEIVLDPVVANMLGRGLSQLFDGSLTAIEEHAKHFPSEQVREGVARIRYLIYQLQTAKEVRLSLAPTGCYAFNFSGDQADQLPSIPQGAVVLTAELTKGITNAVSHSMVNNLTAVIGFADLTASGAKIADFFSGRHASHARSIAETMVGTVDAFKQIDQLVLSNETGGVRLYSANQYDLPFQPSR